MVLLLCDDYYYAIKYMMALDMKGRKQYFNYPKNKSD